MNRIEKLKHFQNEITRASVTVLFELKALQKLALFKIVSPGVFAVGMIFTAYLRLNHREDMETKTGRRCSYVFRNKK